MREFEAVLRTQELGPGEVREVRAHGKTLALINIGQTYHALDAHCPEDGTNLAADGRLMGDLLICPVDHAAFDARTGRRVRPAPGPGLERYAIRVVENAILIGPPITDSRASGDVAA